MAYRPQESNTIGWRLDTKEGAWQGIRAAGKRFMSFTVHLQSKTKIAETPVFCFIGSVNKHINFYDISGGLLKGKKIHPLGPGQQQWQHMVC